MKSKKGIATLYIFLISSAFVITILIIFAIFSFFISSQGMSLKSIRSNDVSFNLLNYLDSPVEEGKISDLINLYYYDKNYEERLTLETKKIFDKIYGQCYYFYILDGDKELIYFGNFYNKKDFEKKIKVPILGKELELGLNPGRYFDFKDKAVERCKIE